MSDQGTPEFVSLPDPAGKALEEPHLPADELEREIGDSEDWDEASEDEDIDTPVNLPGTPMFPIAQNEK
jgi:hypothetical protein